MNDGVGHPQTEQECELSSGILLRWQPVRSWSLTGRRRARWSPSEPPSCGAPEPPTARCRVRDPEFDRSHVSGSKSDQVPPAEKEDPTWACPVGFSFVRTLVSRPTKSPMVGTRSLRGADPQRNPDTDPDPLSASRARTKNRSPRAPARKSVP